MKILSTERVQDGVERLIFAAGPHALAEVQRRERILSDVADLLGAPIDKLREAASNTVETVKRLRHDLEDLQHVASIQKAEALLREAAEVDGVRLIVYSDRMSADFLIGVGNALSRSEDDVVAVMFSETEARLVVKAGEGAVAKGIHSGDLASEIAKAIGGGGGGDPHFAQGGGGDPSKFKRSAKRIREAVKAQLV